MKTMDLALNHALNTASNIGLIMQTLSANMVRACAKASPIQHLATEANGSAQAAVLKAAADEASSISGTASDQKGSVLSNAVLAAFVGANIVQDDEEAPPSNTTTTTTTDTTVVLGIPKTKILVEPFRQGRLVEGGIVYRQTYVVRSYEVGVDKSASLETFLNHFQESALNHVWMSGLLGDGFGATHGMMRNHLIWVVTRMQVEVEKYPKWGDVLELDTWVGASGKNGMQRDWLVRNYKSGEILARATSTWVMMNQETRRLSKMPDEVRGEISSWFIDRGAIKDVNPSEKIRKLGDDAMYINSNLQPRRSDLDMNQHVNNVKYVGWMLETVPTLVHEHYELANITLEYRRECGQFDIVQSLTSPESITTHIDTNISNLANRINNSQDTTQLIVEPYSSLIPSSPSAMIDMTSPTSDFVNINKDLDKPCHPIQYTHLLRLQNDGAEIVRGRTQWRMRASKT